MKLNQLSKDAMFPTVLIRWWNRKYGNKSNKKYVVSLKEIQTQISQSPRRWVGAWQRGKGGLRRRWGNLKVTLQPAQCTPAGGRPSGQSERLAGAGEGSAGAEKSPFSAIFTMQRSPLASLLAFRTSWWTFRRKWGRCRYVGFQDISIVTMWRSPLE